MGCQNSKDAIDSNSVNPGSGIVKKESFRALEEQDRIRIKQVLDYWFSVSDHTASQSSFQESDGAEIQKASGQNKSKGVSFQLDNQGEDSEEGKQGSTSASASTPKQQKKGNKIEPAPLNKVWDRHSSLPPQMMKRWFGGGPHVD